MDWPAWFAVAGFCLAGAMSPGPSLALVLKHTLNAGRRQGMIVGFAHGLGVSLYALGAVLGLVAIITTSPTLFRLVQWAGALFLAYLGLQGLRQKASAPTSSHPVTFSGIHAARDGFLMACFNPYAAIFFIALFSQLVDLHTPFTIKLLYALTAVVIDMGWYMSVAWFFSQPLWIQRLNRYGVWVERGFSLVLLGFAVKLLFG